MLDRVMAGWRYALVGGEGEDGQQKSFTAKARECLSSKAFWRTGLVIAILLMIANLFSPAKEQLRQHGFIKGNSNSLDVSDGGTAGLDKTPLGDDVDWSQYAYCQYVTNEEYLCNSVMIFESLVRLKAKAERLMMYPEEWIVGDDSSAGRLLARARDEYEVRLVPIQILHFNGEPTWADSFTKLLAFNQTEYKRVLSLDSDATVLQPMDELFQLPSAPVAMPRAYWLDDGTLSSQLVLVEPSDFEFQRINAALTDRGSGDFDMEIVNELYGDSCFIIPHRNYDLLTGEFRRDHNDHASYLGSKEEEWNPDEVMATAKFLHYSDWPYQKPWIWNSQASTDQHKPKCREVEGGKQDCRDQEKWLWFYSDFRERREKVCGSGFKRMTKREEEDFAAMKPPSRFEPIFG